MSRWTDCVNTAFLCDPRTGLPGGCRNKSVTIRHSAKRWDRPFSAVTCRVFVTRALTAARTAVGGSDSTRPASGTPQSGVRPLQIIPPTPNTKASIFSQLESKIKILERNMTLAGGFLDQLGRRYKKLNGTIAEFHAEQAAELSRLRDDVKRTVSNISDAQFQLIGGMLLELLNTTEGMSATIRELQAKTTPVDPASSKPGRSLIARVETVLFSFMGTAVALFVFRPGKCCQV